MTLGLGAATEQLQRSNSHQYSLASDMLHVSGHAMLLLACFAGLVSCDCHSAWSRVETQRCLSDSPALRTEPSRSSALDCVLEAEKLSGLLVVQFDSNTRRCSTFRFIDVCQLIGAVGGSGIAALHGCATFLNARATAFMTLSRKLQDNAGSKLRAAWVMSDDEEASKSNLVCGETRQWQTESVEFSSEGAKFNGITSKMWLDSVKFGENDLGLTVLVRMKRWADNGPIFQNYNCRNVTLLGTALWDGQTNSRGLYFQRFAVSMASYNTAPSTNIFDPNVFVEVGATSWSHQSSDLRFYANSAFVPQNKVNFGVAFSNYDCDTFCYVIGYHITDNRKLNGTVRSAVVLNASITEAEIGELFSLLR